MYNQINRKSIRKNKSNKKLRRDLLTRMYNQKLGALITKTYKENI